MLLSDKSIREEMRLGNIQVSPLEEGAVQPCSVDLHLGNHLLKIRTDQNLYLDPFFKQIIKIDTIKISKNGLLIRPNEFLLGSTREWIQLGDSIAGRLDGLSSLARMGLMIHTTGGWVDPGWRGCLTLELFNVSPLSILIRAGMRIAQISFMALSSPAEHTYGHPDLKSKYQGSVIPEASLSYLDYAGVLPTFPTPRPTKGQDGEERRKNATNRCSASRGRVRSQGYLCRRLYSSR